VCNILSVWNNWIVFPEQRIAEYKNIFMLPGTETATADIYTEQSALLPEPTTLEETPPVETHSVDEEPMDEDIDGEPLSDIDGEPLTDDEEDEHETKEQDVQEIEDMFS
jgi:U2-associated protein SR140